MIAQDSQSKKLDIMQPQSAHERQFSLQTLCLFPDIFPVLQAKKNHVYDRLFESILKMFSSSLSQIDAYIINKTERQKIQRRLQDLQFHQYILYWHYGCLIDFRKSQSFNPTAVNLIFAEGSNFDSYIQRKDTQWIAIKHVSKYFEVGKIIAGNFEIINEKQNFKLILKRLIAEKTSIQNKQYSNKSKNNSSWFYKVSKQALQKLNQEQMVLAQQKDQKKVQQGHNQNIHNDQQSTGTIKSKIALEIIKSFLMFLIEDIKLVCLMLLEHKFMHLMKQILNINSFSSNQDKLYRQCLLRMTNQIKQLTNEEIAHDQSLVKSRLIKINKHMNESFKQTIRQFISRQQLNNSINEQKTHIPTFYAIINYNKLSTPCIKAAGSLGFPNSVKKVNNFTGLLTCQYQQNIWIMMVQQFFFDIAIKNLKNVQAPIGINISEIECLDNKSLSIMHQVIIKYEGIMTLNEYNINRYGLMLKNQTYSHIYLIKYIGAAIAFQVLKIKRRKKKSNLDQYKIPQRIGLLYSMFYSLSNQARQALQAMLSYTNNNRDKQPLFVLQKKNSSFYQFANVIAEQTLIIKQWKKKNQSELQKTIHSIKISLHNFKLKYEKSQSKLLQKQNQKCQCIQKQEIIPNHYFLLQKRKEKVECIRCKQIQILKNQIKQFEAQSGNYAISAYPYKQALLYGFINNIPFDILGLMNIIYQSQIQMSLFGLSIMKNVFITQYLHLTPYSEKPASKRFRYCQSYNKSADVFVVYPFKQTMNYYRGIGQQMILSQSKLKNNVLQASFPSRYQFIINSPNIKNSRRQHQNYSNLYHKGKRQSREQFIALANITTCEQTQLIILTQKLKNRQVYIKNLYTSNPLKENCQKKNLLIYTKMLIVLKSVADVNAFQKIDLKTNQLNSYSFIQECIMDLLNNYIDNWRHEDLYFLHISGIIFSIFSKMINKPILAVNLAQRAFDQYTEHSRQNGADNNIKAKLSYFLHGALVCFTQNVSLDKDKQTIHLWTQLQILLRINKIFSDQNMKDTRYSQTMMFFDHYRERAVFNNVENVKDFFLSNLQNLTQIIKIVDQDISSQTNWSYNFIKGSYIFSGLSGNNTYDLNLFTGVLLKNGQQVAGLPQIIKKDHYFKKIFTKNRDLQIYPTIDGSFRTRYDFSQFFPNEPRFLIFFQFKITLNNVILRMIMKQKQNSQKQFKYVLLPYQVIRSCNFIIPVLYETQYFTWYCQSEKHIVFRQKKLSQMKNIGLIFLVKPSITAIFVREGRLIQNRHKKMQLYELSKKSTSLIFDNLKLFTFSGLISQIENQNEAYNLAFKILSSIELKDYIIQIDSAATEGKIKINKFWLHRYNLKFTICPQKGLLSDNFQGYTICQQYNSHQLLPWGSYEKVNCIVLQKYAKDFASAKNHETIILIPNIRISTEQQKNIIPLGQNKKIEIFSYQIHDYFKDIRPKKRIEALHLACLVASCYVPIFQPLMMTNSQYALSIMRSTVSTIPLQLPEIQILQNILQNSIKLNLLSIIFMSQVVYQASISLSTIIPFSKEYSYQRKQIQELKFKTLQAYIQNSVMQYRCKMQIGDIPLRGMLNEKEIMIRGFPKMSVIKQKQRNKSKFEIKNQINVKNKKRTEYLIKQTNQYLMKKLQSISKMKQLQIPKKKKIQQFIQRDPLINNSEIQIQLNFEDDIMFKQTSSQIKSSLISYHKIRQKLNQVDINPQLKKQYMVSFVKQLLKIQKIKQQLLQQLNQMQIHNQDHYDFISGKRKFIKEKDFTNILCNQQQLLIMFPDSKEIDIILFKQIIKLWIKFSIYENTLQRIILLLENPEHFDTVKFLREIQSPRSQIAEILPWLCFQLEMKTQIWLPQFQTFKLLYQHKSGSAVQLNMGEGKTQIIIPMIVLYEIYVNKNKYLPRVNILSTLYKQAQANYYKFLSATGFQISIIPIYFDRNVEINKPNIIKIQHIMNIFKKKSLILIDRDSSLSMILKLQEQQVLKNEIHKSIQIDHNDCNQKDIWMFRNLQLFDIFDEVDALLTAKKSFIYSIGGPSPLPDSSLRFQYCSLFLEIMLKQMLPYLIDHQMIVMQQSLPNSQQAIKQGKFPKGLRFLCKINQNKIMYFRQIIVSQFLDYHLPPQFEFYKKLNNSQRLDIKKYLIDPSAYSINTIEIHRNIPRKVYNQIYAVRGIVAYGILEHCLSLRCGVDYGCPKSDNQKRLGVPYDAADIPSERSQYSHPDVAIILSYLSYFNRGLSFSQFEQAVEVLLCQTESSKIFYYKQWLDSIQVQSKNIGLIKNAHQINLQSIIQKQDLYRSFRYCRGTIVFWLRHCVFQNDLIQFTKSITASSWDIANSVKSLGFSGTKDSHWVFPTYIQLIKSQNDEINGTDGKMIQLMLQYTLQVKSIKLNSQPLWKRFCKSALELKIGCIIDAGAVLAGKSLQQTIVPWISHNDQFKQLGYKGISYCTQKGDWKVYDCVSQAIIDRLSSIPQDQTFVIFDEARTRGADIKMKSNTTAALSLGPNMTKDKLMQAVGRLREFGRNQKIFILSAEQDYNMIEGLKTKKDTKEQVKTIIQWTCINSINENKKMLYPNSKLAWKHFENINSTKIASQQFIPQLETMYKNPIRYETVAVVNKQMANSFAERYKLNHYTKSFVSSVSQYGRDYLVKCQNLDDICEREVQVTEEMMKQEQEQTTISFPVDQTDYIQIYPGKLSYLDIKLDNRLFFSKNFKLCTYLHNLQIANPIQSYQSRNLNKELFQKKLQNIYSAIYNSQHSSDGNELCQIHFVLIKTKSKQFIVITQREANLHLLAKTQFLGPESIKLSKQGDFVVRFQDLNIYLPIIFENNFERALIDAQFFNGHQNFERKQLLLQTIKRNYRIFNKLAIEELVCHFIGRRQTRENKYFRSNLEEICTQILCSQ